MERHCMIPTCNHRECIRTERSRIRATTSITYDEISRMETADVRADDGVARNQAVIEVTDAELDEIKKGMLAKIRRGFEGSQKSAVQDESLDEEGSSVGGPQRSVEEWIIFVTNVPEKAQENEVKDLFKEYGSVMNMHLNLYCRGDYSKGYAIVQYESQKEAAEAIAALNGYNFLGQELRVDWCFVTL